MKKLIALLLALMMALVCVSALAAEGDGDPDGTTPVTEPAKEDAGKGDGNTTQVVSIDPATASKATGKPTKPVQVEIKKSISAIAEKEVYQQADRHPEVTLQFTAAQKSVELSTETTAPEVTFENLTIAENEDYGMLKINLPSYIAVGIYTYTVTEAATNIAGMHEATNLELKVTVVQDPDTGNLIIGGIAVRQDGTKTDNIKNIYKAGHLKVTKDVEGNMGDRTKEFPIVITLNAPTGKTVASTVTYKINDAATTTSVTFTNGKAEVKVNLKHNDSVEIYNIPEGVTYTIVEDSTAIKHVTAADLEQGDKNAYYVENEVTTATAITVAGITEKTIKNTKTIDVDTGVALDSAVYMLIMALALAGFVALKIRRREDY